jgi:triacylglycerol lipase
MSRVAAIATLALLSLPAHAKSPGLEPLPPLPPVEPHQCVVVMHGMARTRGYMRVVERDLEDAGYAVVNRSYPSRKHTIEELAENVGEFVQRCRDTGATRIHFVTHSLGGIVVRYYLRDHVVPEAGRFVMLGTPNLGSELTDRFRGSFWYRLTTGPAGQQIGTGPDGILDELGPIPIEAGVIAGSRAANPAFTDMFHGPNDGKVSVASTRVLGVDHLLVNNSHYFLTRSPTVLRQVRVFLQSGQFEHPAPANITAP